MFKPICRSTFTCFKVKFRVIPQSILPIRSKLSRIAVRVAKWQKEKMMKDAISLKVKETFGKGDEVELVIRPSKILDKKFNVGEKVKLIVIKED